MWDVVLRVEGACACRGNQSQAIVQVLMRKNGASGTRSAVHQGFEENLKAHMPLWQGSELQVQGLRF